MKRHVLAWYSAISQWFGSKTARLLVLGFFVAQAVTLSLVMGIGKPPDELNHLSFIDYYAHHSLDPTFTGQTPTYNLGDKTREVDYLYHYLMSLMVRLLPDSVDVRAHAVRIVSVGIALLTFIVVARLMKRIGVGEAATTAGLAVVTNLPMVLMLAAAVNNDTSVWLGTAVGALLVVRLWQKPTVTDLGLLLIVAVAGGIVKRTLLPIGLVFGVAAVIVLVRQHRLFIAQLRPFRWKHALLALLLIVSIGLFAERVGGNLIRYHAVAPTCNQVAGAGACSVFWGNQRDASLAKLPPQKIVPLTIYPFMWFGNSMQNIVDIQTQSWYHQVKPARFLVPLLTAMLVIGLAFGLWRDGRSARRDVSARLCFGLLLFALYSMAVELAANYALYRQRHVWGLALNGRYILPAVILLAPLAAYYWTVLVKRFRIPRLVGQSQRVTAVVLALGVIAATIWFSGLNMVLRNSPQIFQDSSRKRAFPAESVKYYNK